LEGVEELKKSPKIHRHALSDVLLISRFQNFAADAAQKKRFFETALRAGLLYELIRINSEQKNLRICFIHCFKVKI